MPIPIDELCRLLSPERTSLLLGAGAAVPSGAPTGAELAKRLWASVAKSSADSDDLTETATMLERNYGRRALIEAVRHELAPLTPSGGIQGIPSFPWTQIFSTNFDRLVEKSYRAAGAPLAAMRSNYDLSNKESFGKTALYKIHGCITQDRSLGNKASMVLTEDDYENFSDFREVIFALFNSALLTGDILVIGQSLRDRHLSDLVKEILRAKYKGAPGQLYVLVYSKDDMRAPLLEDRGARVAFGDLDQFIHQLAKGFSPSSPPTKPDGEMLPLSLLGTVVNVSDAIARDGNVVRMFNGGAANYPDIKSNATFERVRSREIASQLLGGDCPVVVITGAAGVGKTTLARQILLRANEEGAHCWEQKEDFSFDHAPWKGVDQELRSKEELGILFVDECTHHLRGVNQLVDHIAESRSHGLRLVIAANSAQWAPRVKSPNIFKAGALVELSKLEVAEIHSLLNLVEHNHEVAALVQPSFKSMTRDDQFSALKRKSSADMFVCLKNIFANESLDTILLQEFDQLDSQSQEHYRYVAALESAGARVHRHLLIRMLSIDVNQIMGALAGLAGIVDEYDINAKEGVYGWRTRHLVIARRITDYKFSGAAELVELFGLIVDNINPAVPVERNSIANICDIEFGIGRIGEPGERIRLYRRLIKVAPAERVPWHRLVRELLAAGEIDEAEYAIRDARAAVGVDAPLDRYAVRLLVLRAQKTSGISASDRIALLRKAYEEGSKAVDRRAWDRHSYKTLCEVALLLFERGADKFLIEEAISRMRVGAKEICDPEMDRDLQRIETERQRLAM